MKGDQLLDLPVFDGSPTAGELPRIDGDRGDADGANSSGVEAADDR